MSNHTLVTNPMGLAEVTATLLALGAVSTLASLSESEDPASATSCADNWVPGQNSSLHKFGVFVFVEKALRQPLFLGTRIQRRGICNCGGRFHVASGSQLVKGTGNDNHCYTPESFGMIWCFPSNPCCEAKKSVIQISRIFDM